MAIQNLSRVTTLAASDLVALFSGSLGNDAAVTLATLTQYLQQQMTIGGSMVTQYSAPNATGFSVSILAAGDGLGQNVWLLLTPVAGYAAGTIVLPSSTISQDQQELLVSTTQAITTLTINGNGASVNGAPTTLAANGFFRLRFDGVFKAWYRVG